jgi:hypothetical protein
LQSFPGLCDKESPIWVSAEEEKELGQDAKVGESSKRCMTVADAVDFWSLPKKKLESLDCLTHNRESRFSDFNLARFNLMQTESEKIHTL